MLLSQLNETFIAVNCWDLSVDLSLLLAVLIHGKHRCLHFSWVVRKGNLTRTGGCQFHMGVSLEAQVSWVSVVLMSTTEEQQKLHGVYSVIVG